MTDATAETQTCPFCYTELDARATVCGQCGAVKDLTPTWMSRLKFYGLSVGLILVGLLLAFVDGKGINWWAVPFVVIGAAFLAMGRKVDLSDQLWHRKE
jgi:ribosomal protein L40E